MTRSGISLVIVALLLQAPATRAAPLDKDSCAKLKTEQVQLEHGGARGSMGKGPEWAKTNLAPEKLEQIGRLIELDEQILFRCGGRPLVVLPHDPDPAAREVESKDGAKGPPAKAAKAPGADKKKAVPLKRAAAPPLSQPAGAKKSPPAKTTPQPEASPTPAPAKEGADSKAAAVKSEEPAKTEVGKEVVPVKAAPQPEAATATVKQGEEKKAAAPPVELPAKEAPAKTTPPPEVDAALAKEAEAKKAAAIKAAKAKAKKKANDAYSPAPFDWFAGAPAGKK